MNCFLEKVAIICCIFISSTSLFGKDYDLVETQKKPFQPKFSLASGIYTLTGDIKSQESGLLKGQTGYNAGMKFEISNNFELSFLFFQTSFSGNNDLEQFSSDVDGIGLDLGYTVNQLFQKSKIQPVLFLGAQRLNIRNNGENSSAIVIPLGLALRMDFTERLQFDVALNFGLGMGDIDMSENDGADSYKALKFAIHYDLFTPQQNKDDYFDESYYADVDFLKLETEDQDSDLVPDIDDYCPETPIGVKVDKNGCPLDDDRDGIPNYLDKQKKTPVGSIVDENGVRLTKDKYKGVYSDIEVASRKYANFYNQTEIKRENYKTIDEYLIAKANAFNKAFNKNLNETSEVLSLIYKVKIGEFKDGVPAEIANKLLSLDDLESFTMSNDAVIYAVGNYPTLDGAMSRMFDIEDKGFEDTYIIVDNNGEISNYVEPAIHSQEDKMLIDSTLVVDTTSQIIAENINTKSSDVSINETTYRIQIGAFNKPLSKEIFVGVSNVNFFTGKDGLVRYTTGSFTDYKDAIDYQMQMKARGFDDAFIVTYNNGERIGLNVAISLEDSNLKFEEKTPNKVAKDLDFTVQIMVTSSSVSANDLLKMTRLGNIDKEKSGNLYKYYAGTYSDLEEAKIKLQEAKLAGFSDAFIFAIRNGERITLEQAEEILK